MVNPSIEASQGPSLDERAFYCTQYAKTYRPKWTKVDPPKEPSGCTVNERGMRQGSSPRGDYRGGPARKHPLLRSRRNNPDFEDNVVGSTHRLAYCPRPETTGSEDFQQHQTQWPRDHGGFVVNNSKFQWAPEQQRSTIHNRFLLSRARERDQIEAENDGVGPHKWTTQTSFTYQNPRERTKGDEVPPTDKRVDYPYPQGYTRNDEGFEPKDRLPDEYLMNTAHPLHHQEYLRALSSKRLEHEGFVFGTIAQTSFQARSLPTGEEGYPPINGMEKSGFSRSYDKPPYPSDSEAPRKELHPGVLKMMKVKYPVEYEERTLDDLRQSITKTSHGRRSLHRATTAPERFLNVDRSKLRSGFSHSLLPSNHTSGLASDFQAPRHTSRNSLPERRLETEGNTYNGRSIGQSSYTSPQDEVLPIFKGFPSTNMQEHTGFSRENGPNPMGLDPANINHMEIYRSKLHPTVKKIQRMRDPVGAGKTVTNVAHVTARDPLDPLEPITLPY